MDGLTENLVAEVIFAAFGGGVLWIRRRLRRKGIPLRIFVRASFSEVARFFGRDSIDGFYYAVYDFSNREIQIGDAGKRRELAGEIMGQGKKNALKAVNSRSKAVPNDNKSILCAGLNENKVVECIYVRTAFFSNKMTGYVLRRARRKSGSVVWNENLYLPSQFATSLRFVGRFSKETQIFFGYWMDPTRLKKVAGTVRLKSRDNSADGAPDQRRAFLAGHWCGVQDNDTKKISEESHDFYGFPDDGGVWRFYRIGPAITDFTCWREELQKDGAADRKPDVFLDWIRI